MAVVLFAAGVRADGDVVSVEEPPLVGQPDQFMALGGAVGSGFRVTQKVSSPTATTEQPLTLTVRITAETVQRPPRRPRLWELKVYQELERKKLLKIDRPDGKKRDLADRSPAPRAWEFDYQLRPLSEKLSALPRLPFDFYKPSRSAGLPGRYEKTYSDEVPLKITPRVEPVIVLPPPINVPPALLHIAEGAAVVERRSTTAALPALPWLVMWMLLPPLMSIALCWLWRRWNPDAARLAQLRQSRAARHALHALHAVEQHPARVSAIAAGYLQQRLGLPTTEPTPTEAAACLERAGASTVLAGKMAEFFRACDAARFAPVPQPGAGDLVAAARSLILTLEAETWSASSS